MDNFEELIGIICIAGEPYNEPKGTCNIIQNGEYNIKPFAYANVNVPQGITPSGTLSIVNNGTHDVTNYAEASVNVPQGVFPSGVLPITENGEYDVTNYAGANVNVPQGVFPSGTLSINANDTYDVTNYASASINVRSYSETLLWTNPSLSSDFPASTLNIDFTDYDYMKLIYTPTSESESSQYLELIMPVSQLDDTDNPPTFGAYNVESSYYMGRLIRRVNSTSIAISRCSVGSVYTNATCKPVQIYGVNF